MTTNFTIVSFIPAPSLGMNGLLKRDRVGHGNDVTGFTVSLSAIVTVNDG